MKGFENIGTQEKELLLEVPVLITFLIAGSDNNIDTQEREWAQKLVEFRSMKNESDLVEYYLQVERKWEPLFQKYAARLVDYDDPDLRNHFLSAELAKASPVLAKLPSDLADKLHNSFKTFAVQVAKASGGLFGLGAVSPEEHEWLSLPMLQNPAEK